MVLVAGLRGRRVASLVVVDETEFAVVTSFGRIVAVYGDEPVEAGSARQGAVAARAQDRSAIPGLRPAAARGDHRRQAEPRGRVVRRLAGRGPGLVPARLGQPRAGRGAAERAGLGRAERRDRPPRPGRAGLDRRGALGARRADAGGHDAPSRRPRGSELGVEVLDVRLRRFNHPVEVRPAVFDLIRSERRQVAAKLRAEGEAQYLTITSQADRTRDTILAEAEAEAQRIRGNAEAEATRVLNEAHARDPKFFEFLRTLESYRSILDGQTTVVLSSSSPAAQAAVAGPSIERSAETAVRVASQSRTRPVSHEEDSW